MPQVRAIYQASLDAMTQAMRLRDFPAFLRQIRLPQTLSTVDGSIIHRDEAALERTFTRYLDELVTRGVDRIERSCIAARIDGLGILDGYHVTRLWAGTEPAVRPFTTQLKFEKQADGAWKNYLSVTGTTSANWPILPPEASVIAPRGIETRDFEAFGIFQTLVNTVTQQYLTGNVEGLHALIDYPVRMYSRTGDSTFERYEEMAADFLRYMDDFRMHCVTDIVRSVRSARYVAADRIKGHYRTYIMSGDQIVVEPYESDMTLVLHADGTWRMKEILHSLGHMAWTDGPQREEEAGDAED